MIKLEDIRKLNSKEKSMTSGFKTSGIQLEAWVEERFKSFVRQPAKSDYDFIYNGLGVDVKGCSASAYGYNIFIETVQNTKIGSIPTHIKKPDCILFYVDYETGICYMINWKKMLTKLQANQHPEVSGGYNAMGYKINIFDHLDCIMVIETFKEKV